MKPEVESYYSGTALGRIQAGPTQSGSWIQKTVRNHTTIAPINVDKFSKQNDADTRLSITHQIININFT